MLEVVDEVLRSSCDDCMFLLCNSPWSFSRNPAQSTSPEVLKGQVPLKADSDKDGRQSEFTIVGSVFTGPLQLGLVELIEWANKDSLNIIRSKMGQHSVSIETK